MRVVLLDGVAEDHVAVDGGGGIVVQEAVDGGWTVVVFFDDKEFITVGGCFGAKVEGREAGGCSTLLIIRHELGGKRLRETRDIVWGRVVQLALVAPRVGRCRHVWVSWV